MVIKCKSNVMKILDNLGGQYATSFAKHPFSGLSRRLWGGNLEPWILNISFARVGSKICIYFLSEIEFSLSTDVERSRCYPLKKSGKAKNLIGEEKKKSKF